jgi:formate dehydrogenase major subunit
MKTNRRSFLKIMGGVVAGAGVGTCSGLALGDVGADAKAIKNAAEKAKLVGAKEFTTACNFCSVGCGMVCHVRDGKLLNLEGDPDHVISLGGLCSKGAAMRATHDSDQRAKSPLYRAPGATEWQKISWDEALEKIANKMKAVRDSNWIETEKDGDKDVPVNRTDALAFMGGAQHTNEECYLFQKMGRTAGSVTIEHQARL